MRLARTQLCATVVLSWIERGKTDASRKSHLLHHIKEWTVGLEAAIS